MSTATVLAAAAQNHRLKGRNRERGSFAASMGSEETPRASRRRRRIVEGLAIVMTRRIKRCARD